MHHPVLPRRSGRAGCRGENDLLGLRTRGTCLCALRNRRLLRAGHCRDGTRRKLPDPVGVRSVDRRRELRLSERGRPPDHRIRRRSDLGDQRTPYAARTDGLPVRHHGRHSPRTGRSGGARPCRRADPSQCPVAGYPAARELPDGHILLPDRSGQALSGEPRAHALQQVRGSQLHFHVARRAGFAGFDQLCRQFLLRTPPRLLRQSLPEIRQSREPVDLLHPGYRTLLRRCARTEQTGRRLDGRAARLRQVARTLCPVLLRAAPFDRRTCRPPRADHRPDLSGSMRWSS